jgi:hypothetical protein
MPAEQITERFQRQPERFAVTLIDVSSQVFKEFNGVYVNCDHCGGPVEIHGEEASLPASTMHYAKEHGEPSCNSRFI